MRRKRNVEREIKPDLQYGNALVAKLINYVMRRGKKITAEKIVYGAFDLIQKQHGLDPISVFTRAVEQAAPLLEIRPRRIGGATYQVPREVNPRRRISLALRWILNAARAQAGKPMAARLADELLAASKNEGAAIKKKQDMHRMAEANKAFAHFAW